MGKFQRKRRSMSNYVWQRIDAMRIDKRISQYSQKIANSFTLKIKILTFNKRFALIRAQILRLKLLLIRLRSNAFEFFYCDISDI